ncbi:hydratase [Treponema parvum]|uniref:Hydratase n=1 Tax=Treponema parvum TaxID=138851 RepID=A0A975F4E4_9SPIR|nr:hydratase [Treponema parvum]QTQ14419.1 hydratase [Treponema parvum]
MIKLYEGGAYLFDGIKILSEKEAAGELSRRHITKDEAKKGTIAYSILKAHNHSGNMNDLRLRFDAMASHDITFVGIIQTAMASGMKEFPVPYVLTNCHNSLCAVGGTINEDDHMFGLSACKKFGGIFVPPHIAVIHQYMREAMAGCSKMILASDSHTRYGALGTMAVGEGGGELVKQLLQDTYDIAYPEIVGVYLEGSPSPAVGPQDIALAIIGKVFKNGYVKNKVMEFVGPGIASMSADYRNGIDVMTTETTCWSSIWKTDEEIKNYLITHGRENEYKELNPSAVAYYDGMIRVNLSEIKPMIALPFHPSNVYTIKDFTANAGDILRTIEKDAETKFDGRVKPDLTGKLKNGKFHVQQGIIAGCAGGNYTNVIQAAHILKDKNCGDGEFSLSVYPSSQPVYFELVKNGALSDLIQAGVTVKTAYCGPCFGAGDTPANEAFSIRHTTRNFPNREGSKPGNGQISSVALMDARSIAATAVNKGILTSAEDISDLSEANAYTEYHFNENIYKNRVYQGFGKAEPSENLVYGPNIKPWPEQKALFPNILLKVCAKIMDAVTTTDELIPSGETSSYRSNPIGLAEFTLSRRDPEYVGRAKAVFSEEKERSDDPAAFSKTKTAKELLKLINSVPGCADIDFNTIEIGSVIYAVKPGDGSAREQAASCQRVLGGLANIAREYATKRYRSNVINWGMLPLLMEGEPDFENGSYIFVPEILKALDGDMQHIKAYVLPSLEKNEGSGKIKQIEFHIAELTESEKRIIKDGCLINFNRNRIS